MKFLVLILTSHDPHLAKLGADSALLATRHAKHEYRIGVVVNSTDPAYFGEVRAAFANDPSILMFHTESNGHPGKGHNSVLEVFSNLKEYDYLIKIDGDDLLHESALYMIEQAIEIVPGLDLLGLQAHEKIMATGILTDKYPLLHEAWLAGYFDVNRDLWKSINFPDPFVTYFGQCSVPQRYILFSQKSVSGSITPHVQFSLEGRLADMLPLLVSLYHHERGTLKLAFTSTNYIYLVNTLCGSSVTNTGTRDWSVDDAIFRSELNRLGLPNHLWGMLTSMPYLDIPNPKFYRTGDKVYLGNKYVDCTKLEGLDWMTRLPSEEDRWPNADMNGTWASPYQLSAMASEVR